MYNSDVSVIVYDLWLDTLSTEQRKHVTSFLFFLWVSD